MPSDSGGEVEDAVQRSIRLHRRWATTSGGATGVGGFLVLPATLTAGMASAYVINARMIGTIAHLRGYDLDSEEVRTVVHAALFGAAGAGAAQKVSKEIGEKALRAQVGKRVSGKALTKINQRVGFRFITKAGEKGVVNMTRLVPLVGAPIGATAENLTTRAVSRYALRSFPPLPSQPGDLAMTSFDTDKKSLTFLLDQIENCDLALPDFQRDFVWDAGATRELVRSVMQSFPAGTLLLMRGGAKHFMPRRFSEAPELPDEPSYLVLDGQQRLTSLSLAFNGRGTHRYFLHLQELMNGEDLDEAVEVYPARQVKKWASIEGQAADLALPLARLRDFANWRDEVLDVRETTHPDEDRKALRGTLNDLEKLWVKPVEAYQFPVTTLSRETDLEAVCTIFETLNRTGVKLSVFDLLTARGFAQSVQLRSHLDMSRGAYANLEAFDVDPYYILQVIALWTRGEVKRSVILKLDPVSEIEPHWDKAAKALHDCLEMLRTECGVLTKQQLPYRTMLLTLAAVWPTIDEATGPERGARREKLIQWFWCATFAQRYETQSNTRSQVDYPLLTGWLTGVPDTRPDVVIEAASTPNFRAITPRQSALYRALMALSLRDAPRDFHEGKPLTPQRIVEESVDDHHIFPQAYLGKAVEKGLVDCVLNRTLIDKITNIRISSKAPSVYLQDMATSLSEQLLDDILESHGLSTDRHGSLFEDEYEAFLRERAERLETLLRDATGWSNITRDAATRESELLTVQPDFGPIFRGDDAGPGRVG